MVPGDHPELHLANVSVGRFEFPFEGFIPDAILRTANAPVVEVIAEHQGTKRNMVDPLGTSLANMDASIDREIGSVRASSTALQCSAAR